jgi:RNA polymerase sigma-70 factor (ECF subfamily)
MKKGQLIQLRPEARVDEMSDAGLVAACAAEDRTARALLFERHVDSIHRFVSRMRASDADAVDDLVQATFIRAFQGAGRFHGTSARSWLYGIAANVVREHARKEIRRKRAMSVVAEEMPRTTHTPEGTLWRRLFHARTALRKAIDGGRS